MRQVLIRSIRGAVVPAVALATSRVAPMMLALVALAACSGQTRAAITLPQVSRTLSYSQTADGQAVPQGGLYAQFTASLSLGAVGDYTQATFTAPGSSTPINMTLMSIGTSSLAILPPQAFASLDLMDDAFPLGEYIFEATGPAGSASVTLDNPAHFYPGIPTLSETNYSDLLGMDPGADFTLRWDPLVAGPATQPWISLTIFDLTGPSPVTVSESLAGAATSYQIAAGTFQAGHDYSLVLNFQNVLDANETRQAYSQNTRVNFTVVPEPGSLVMTALGVVGVGLAACARRRR